MLKFLKDKKISIFFIIYFVALFVLSTTLMPMLSLEFSKSGGISAGADILLGSVISLGLLRGKKRASLFGMVVGFIFDIYVGNPYDFSPLIYFLCAYCANYAATPFSRKTPLSAMLVAAMLVWIKSLFSFFYLIATSGESGIPTILLYGVLPEYIANVISAAVCFTVMRIAMAIFRIPVKGDIGR